MLAARLLTAMDVYRIRSYQQRVSQSDDSPIDQV